MPSDLPNEKDWSDAVRFAEETANLRESRNANREPLHPRLARLSRARAARWMSYNYLLIEKEK